MTFSPHTPPSQKKPSIVRWICGILFLLFALVNGFHYSSLFLLGAAILMLPLSPITDFFQKQNIKPAILILISIVLFVFGTLTAPETSNSDGVFESTETSRQESNSSESSTSDKSKNTTDTSEETDKPVETTRPTGTAKPTETTRPTGTAKPTETTSKDENKTLVWVTSSGKKYHTNPKCSNMRSPQQISLKDAEKQGYTPCKKCH